LREEKEKILKEVLRLLSEKYPIGLYEYLYKHCPDLYNQLLELENSIDQTYLNASIDQLKAVLREYWTFHMTAIREFKQTGQLGLNLSQVRQEMTAERVRA
jgi:Fic family protein